MGNLISRQRSRKRRDAILPQTRSMPIHSMNARSPANLQACHGYPAPPATNTNKALLIGIQYKTGRCPKSRSMDLGQGPHMETQAWRDMLLTRYNYAEGQITSMTDIRGNKGTHLWPNRDNILRQLEDLVRDVKSGDRRFLLIAAHGDQCDCTSDWTELDGKDEVMYSFEDNEESCLVIKDNELRRILVDKFPAGAYLTIVLELCNSGTLIDLPFRLYNRGKNKLPTLGPAKKKPIDLQGDILCLAACEDWQKAYTFTQESSRYDQGILTTIIQHSLANSRGDPSFLVKQLHAALIETCKARDSSEHKPAQTPVVTLGRKLSKKELEILVFRP